MSARSVSGILMAMIKKVVRIGTVEGQDAIRRADSLLLTPAERVAALILMRDQMFPGRLDKRAVCIRVLSK